jgi:acyl carrier protein
VACFRAIFPGVPADQIPGASTETIGEWDSLASIRLIAVIEEEFHLVIPVEQYAAMSSFQQIHTYVLRNGT